MTLDKLLTPNSVIANLKATNKKQALQELARHASTLTGVDERRIFDVLLERERLGSTGVGGSFSSNSSSLEGPDAMRRSF